MSEWRPIPALEPNPLFQAVHLNPELGEFAAAEAVPAGTLQAIADLVGFAAKAESLALGNDPVAQRTIDALIDLVDLPDELVDRPAVGTAVIGALAPAAILVLRGSRDGRQGGGRDGDGDEQLTHLNTPCCAIAEPAF